MIVVDDGSTDEHPRSPRIRRHGSIRTENRGLSRRPQHRLAGATGEIVAYLDDDARPDPHWLRYLAAAFIGDDACRRRRAQHPPSRRGSTRCIAEARAGRCTCSSPTARRSTSPAATWRSGGASARRSRRLRPPVPSRRRRRGHLLAPAAIAAATLGFNPAAMVWHHAPRLRRDVLTPAARLRARGGAARAEVARALQPRRTPHVVRSRVRRSHAQIMAATAGASTTAPGGSGLFQSVYERSPSAYDRCR